MSLSEQLSEAEETQTWTMADHLYGDDDESFLRRATPYNPVPRWRLKTILKDFEDEQDLPEVLSPAEESSALWRDDGPLPLSGLTPTVDQTLHSEQTVRDDRLSVQYKVTGLKSNEIPVIGLYVDRRVCPGFRYRVRYNSTEEYAFRGEPWLLASIGMGYSSRLTFTKGQGSSETYCFWPDNRDAGYSFSIDVLRGGDSFTVVDSAGQVVGDAVVHSVNKYQMEQSMEADSGTVRKYVCVHFACTVTYFQRHSDIINIDNKEDEVVKGIAEVVKEKREKEARTQCIADVFLSRVGNCTFHLQI
ncbi:hypothetical protein ScPMuIL_011875 [Solemya velum]